MDNKSEAERELIAFFSRGKVARNYDVGARIHFEGMGILTLGDIFLAGWNARDKQAACANPCHDSEVE